MPQQLTSVRLGEEVVKELNFAVARAELEQACVRASIGGG